MTSAPPPPLPADPEGADGAGSLDDPRRYSSEYIRHLLPEEKKDLRRRGILPLARQTRTFLRRQSEAITDLELRDAVLRGIRQGYDIPTLATLLGRSKQKLYKCRKNSLRTAIKRAYDEQMYGPVAVPEPPIPRRIWKLRLWKKRMRALPPFTRNPAALPVPLPEPLRKPPPPQRRARFPWAWSEEEHRFVPIPLPPPRPEPELDDATTAEPRPDGQIPDEILDAPEVVQMRRDCLMLRKAMYTFDQIADALGITNIEARQYTYEALQELQSRELNNAELERRLMIEQLDEMLAAIHPLSTGKDLRTGKRPVVLEAIDRSIKLLAKKAELLGLTQPPAVDIRLKLQSLAAEGGYDILEIEEIARTVLASHKIRLPEI